VVGADGDAIAGYAGVVRRDIEHAGEVFRTYGLSSMFTFPDLRRRGFGSSVVEAATARSRHADDGDIAVLSTMAGMEPSHERHGWQATSATQFLIGDRASPRLHDDAAMMLFVSAKANRHRAAFEHARVHFGEEGPVKARAVLRGALPARAAADQRHRTPRC
jgi:hypothetical protein